MWLYAAPGSGVSINVGRSVIMSFEAAARLLRRVYPDTLECACEPECEFGVRMREGNDDRVLRNGSSCIAHFYWHRDGASSTTAGGGGDGALKLRRAGEGRCWTRRDVIDQLDTIQIYDHLEYYGRERRHEIVRLRHGGECAKLNAATPDLMCGRTPFLTRCAEGSAALRRVTRCVSGKEPLSQGMAAAVNYTRGRCAMTSVF